MSVVSPEVLVAAPIERLYDVIVDYERYPEFVPGIKACRVKSQRAPREVEYELDLGIKRVRYLLRHEEIRPTRVSWSLVSGEMMKVSSGSWDLRAEGQGTQALYAVDIQIARPPLVPQALIDKVSDELTRVQLPRTLHAFKARAEAQR
jgi:coenzyme Q-binding protein COQ10